MLNIKILQGKVATMPRCGGIFNCHFIAILLPSTEVNFEISQHLAKLYTRAECPVNWLAG